MTVLLAVLLTGGVCGWLGWWMGEAQGFRRGWLDRDERGPTFRVGPGKGSSWRPGNHSG